MDPKAAQTPPTAARPLHPPRVIGNPAPSLSPSGGRPLVKQQQQQQQTKQPASGPTYRDFRLVSAAGKGSKKTLHNLMILNGTKPISLKEFTKPIKLQRKDPHAHLPIINNDDSMEDVKVEEPQKGPKTGADTSLIAPMGGATKNKQLLFKKRTKQIFLASEETLKLRETEHKPWILEDDDDQSWSGTLEGGQQSNYVFFVFAENGFKVVPANKWYRFKQKIPYQTLTIDQAEEQLKRRSKHDAGDRWLMQKDKKKAAALGLDKGDQEGGIYQPEAHNVVVGRNNRGDSNKRDSEAEFDEFDFEAVLSDDEEGHEDLEAEDEDTKTDRARAKREAVKDLVSDEEEDDIKKATTASKLTQEGKVVKKHLKKIDKTVYADDEEEDPYASGEDMLDSDAEDEADREVKQEPEIAMNAAQQLLKRPAAPTNVIKKKKESSSPPVKTISSSELKRSASFDKKALDKKKAPSPIGSSSKPRSPAASPPPASIKQEKTTSPSPTQFPRTVSAVKIEGQSSRALSPSATGSSITTSTPAGEKKRKRIKHEDQTSGGETSGGEASSNEAIKKRKAKEIISDQAGSPSSARSPTPAQSDNLGEMSADDPNLITEADVIAALRGKRLSPIELLRCFKEKLKKDERNRNVVRQLAKKIAKVNDGLLELKE